VRQHRIETFASCGGQRTGSPKQQCKAQDCGEHDGEAVFLEGFPGGTWKGKLFPTVLAHIGQGLRQVQFKLMRGGVLAGIVAAPAIVTEVRQLR